MFRLRLFFLLTGWLLLACGATAKVDEAKSLRQPVGTPPSPPYACTSHAMCAMPRIAVGESHTLVLSADGTVWAVGINTFGQLGDGTNINNATPVQAQVTDVVAIAAGRQHSLAVKADGTVWSWGNNGTGQLGVGDESSNVPVQVPGLSSVVAVSAAWSHSFALKSDGDLWAWGDNGTNQLLVEENPDFLPLTPQLVLTGVKAIATARFHSVALKTDDTVWAWGFDGWGQVSGLGLGLANDILAPTQVLTGAVSVAAADGLSMAVKADGTLWGWGENGYGELGAGQLNYPLAPVQVAADVSAIAVATNRLHFITTAGTLWSRGRNANGVLGDGTTLDRVDPVPVLAHAIAVAGGVNATIALRRDGRVFSWGRAITGQLGRDSDAGSAWLPGEAFDDGVSCGAAPLCDEGVCGFAACAGQGTCDEGSCVCEAPGFHGPFCANDCVDSVNCSGHGTCAATGLCNCDVNYVGTGCTACRAGYDGYPDCADTTPPVINWFSLTTEAVSDAGAQVYFGVSAADTADGTVPVSCDAAEGSWFPVGESTVTCTAIDAAGNAADAGFPVLVVDTTPPVLSLPGSLVAEVQHDGGAEVHFDASAVDLVDGSPQVTCEPSSGSTFPVGETEVLCDAIDGSGNRSDGGFFVTVYRPFSDRCEVHPECASPKFSVGQHSLLVRGDGAVFASGRRAFGALGDGVSDGSCRNTPMPVPGLDAVKAVAVGANHSLAVRNDGTVWAWGRAALGTGDDALPVTQVPVLHDVVDVAVGDTHALALARDSTVWGWGRNHRLQLGATLPDTGVEQPVQLEGLAGVRQVVAMGDSSWVVKDDGTVWGLGENNGLLGGSVGSPVKAVGVSGVARVRTGPLSVFAIRHDGAVWVWGRPRNVSQGGVPGQNATPHLVWGLDGVVDLASATTHTLVLKADGTVWGWGQNEWGQLGTSVSPEGTSTLAQVEGVTNAVGVFAWGPLSMALLRDGSMRWWGLSVCGNHGTNGGFLNSYMPQVSHFTFDTGCGEAPGCFDNVCGFRGCSARGVCGSGGSCACEPGFFGALCEEQDSEPPVLTVPSQVQVPATSAAGEPVSWEASAEDALDGPVPVTCEPPSGSLFAPGVSTVTCSAMDSAGNVATASFEVLVEPLDAGVPGTDAGVESPGEPRGCGCGLAGAQWLTVCALWLLRRRPQQALAPSQSEES